MRYKLLGRSGLRVSELALGTMTFGEEWGWGDLLPMARELDLAVTPRSILGAGVLIG